MASRGIFRKSRIDDPYRFGVILVTTGTCPVTIPWGGRLVRCFSRGFHCGGVCTAPAAVITSCGDAVVANARYAASITS